MKYKDGDIVLFKVLDREKHQKHVYLTDETEMVKGDSDDRLNWLEGLVGQQAIVEWANGATYVVRFPTGDLVRLHTSELQGRERAPVELVQPALGVRAEPGKKTYMEFETKGGSK